MQGMMAQYLEQSIASFLDHQERIREQMQNMMGAANPLTVMNRIADQNMAMWNMFNPNGTPPPEGGAAPDGSQGQSQTGQGTSQAAPETEKRHGE